MISFMFGQDGKMVEPLPFSNYVNSGISFAGQRTFTTGSVQESR
jgi:hypothetical protein